MANRSVSMGEQSETKEPSYRDCLGQKERDRYDDKLTLINGSDPYEINSWTNDVKLLPNVTYPDIVNYLVFSKSPYTAEDLKSYKSLTAYTQFVSGWVRELCTVVIEHRHVVKAKVLHSQRLREKPLTPWVITEKDGNVKAAHCNCMAGLGEACTHIGALLFAVEGTVKLRNSKTVTQEAAYWKTPSSTPVPYSEVREIDFTAAKTHRKRMMSSAECTPEPAALTTPPTVPQPTNEDLEGFFQELASSQNKVAILSVIGAHNDSYVPISASDCFPKPLTELRDDNAVGLGHSELIKYCHGVDTSVTAEQADSVERATKVQSKTKTWFNFRAGRVTASKMREACHTDPFNPSQSLVKRICYPREKQFQTSATKWGSTHEQTAREALLSELQKHHQNVVIEDSGLVISPEHPYIAASPDGIVRCDCCGESCLEIKCPFSLKDKKLSQTQHPNSYLKPAEDGTLTVDRKHPCYYQMQTQMGVTKLDACYFVVWTLHDIHVEVVNFDVDLWDTICLKSKTLFEQAILPELVGKFYSTLSSQPLSPCVDDSPRNCNTTAASEIWCYCGQGEFGRMIACENENCKIAWFHFPCVKISSAPKGKWFCADCRKENSRKRRRVTNPCSKRR